ncbi:DUF6192 family protein [Streptomyces rimosus]|uniref:DUF6192 family protein n=1 Tax=Streptomyces rimosus TaxID=1927 RepID=UPI00067B6F23|nr:DUF6192 family protein [Streptomyces rimosus]
MAASTVEDWRWIASRWPKDRRREEAVTFGIHRILASVRDETERWKAIDDPPYHQRSATHRWTHDAAKRRVGQRAERPETVAEKVQAVAELTQDEEVAARAAENLLRRPESITKVSPTSRARAVHELTRDEEVATQVAGELLQRPAVARKTMRDTATRMLVNRAQFANSEETRQRILQRTPRPAPSSTHLLTGLPADTPTLLSWWRLPDR